jgi:hypothetical protein
MKKELMNLFLFIGICFLLYLLFRNLNVNREGLTVANSDKNEGTSTTNGIAGNAAAYAASIKSENIKHQDTFLINKYRSDYETAILNLDDLIVSNQSEVIEGNNEPFGNWENPDYSGNTTFESFISDFLKAINLFND